MRRHSAYLAALLAIAFVATGTARLAHEWAAHGLFSAHGVESHHACDEHGHEHETPADNPGHSHPGHDDPGTCHECSMLAGAGSAPPESPSQVVVVATPGHALEVVEVRAPEVASIRRARGRAPPLA